ncbi:TPA: RNA-guided pseudouridylation complex pseudouridine synthase subunit Cbf5 [archaeon]|uniref:Probable tRNA pseudouridine synthase B n=1 Tax=Candidatus Naiadarchaeum limnaeum TaxID=2756139 RepID=A0A832UNL6_9ARCH|nr:RNA-guided pseudouridylation complex pseudouridine synthase subunit Cbf5 [Candidatus Naiadarchaeales archaeon SRR2090153.bin1042]HIK00509.1 RNA-guided pseudouridylation complex pseudouridine synthase subunit Cbf5 [Candidatus Naiadarchaeum limnaeum]
MEDKLVVKHEENSDSNHGKSPEERTIEELLQTGIVNIDKPAGPTSFQVTENGKKILDAKKAGHAGTLDPGVSGVFVVGLNDGTKILKALLEAPKEYICLMRLHESAELTKLKKIFSEFSGKIFQTPPVKAAVKRVLRIREIYEINLIEKSGKDVLFQVLCESGTYIRRLCHDIGLALGTAAHMQQLRRTKTGPFDESSIVTLHELADAFALWKEEGDEKYLRRAVQPLENGLSHLQKVIISDSAVNSITHGAQLAVPGILKYSHSLKRNDLLAAFTQKGEAVMLGQALMDSDEIMEVKKGIAVKTERVLIGTDIYPRYKK